jgi:hypothetical protein
MVAPTTVRSATAVVVPGGRTLRWATVVLPLFALVWGGAVFAAMPLAPVWDWERASGVESPPSAAIPAVDRGVDHGATQRTGEVATKGQMRREAEDLQRQDVAADLTRMGMSVKWQEHTLGDLLDWRARMQMAQVLRWHYGVEVDWRSSSLPKLTDMRLRANKAGELSSSYGVTVNWQRYSWAALESLRRKMARLPALEAGASGAALDEDALVRPGLGRRGRGWRPFAPEDPDRLLAPTFAFNTPLVWSRHPSHATRWDRDALIRPTFVPVPPPAQGPDDVIDPWTRPFGEAPGRAAGHPSGRRRQ